MTWKSYTAVSGATVLAGWLASSPQPANAPDVAVARSPQRATDTAGSDIEEQAMRLQVRLRAEREYTTPRRDLFRFAPQARTTNTEVPAPRAEEPLAPPPAIPQGPAVTLSGIAEDQVNGQIQRTAVLSSPAAGVLLVREGDEVLAAYRVARIEAEAVELVRLSDGSTHRVTLGR